MGNELSPARSFLRELLRIGVYKRTQGRIARQVTCATVWVACLLGGWRLWSHLGVSAGYRHVLAGALILAGLWIGYRLVNLPQFADFLIAVEAEMNKVSWPSGAELVRSSMVVIFVIFLLAIVLFGYDLLWQAVFSALGVRP